MQTLLVAVILAVVVGAVFLIARRGYWGYPQHLPVTGMTESFTFRSVVAGGAADMTKTAEFVLYLFWIGMLIGALHVADVRPWAERITVIGWPILIAVSVWLIGWYLPTRH
jgi:hypothetical protein